MEPEPSGSLLSRIRWGNVARLLALPALARVLPVNRTWLWVPVVAWFAPWYWLLPTALDPRWD